MSIYLDQWMNPALRNVLLFPNLQVVDHDYSSGVTPPGLSFRFWTHPLVGNKIKDSTARNLACFSMSPMPACCGLALLSGWGWSQEATKEQNKMVFDVLKRIGTVWRWTRGFLVLNPGQTHIVTLLGQSGLPPYHHDGFKNLNSNNHLDMYTIELR
jgi:hypothetical protein